MMFLVTTGNGRIVYPFKSLDAANAYAEHLRCQGVRSVWIEARS